MTRLTLFIVVCMLAGCGYREVKLPDGSTQSEVFLGLGTAVDCTEAPGLSADITVLGLWTGGNGNGLGFHSGQYVCGSPECQVVIWQMESSDSLALHEMLKSLNNVCVVS